MIRAATVGAAMCNAQMLSESERGVTMVQRSSFAGLRPASLSEVRLTGRLSEVPARSE